MRLKFMYSAMILAAAVILASCNAVDTAVNSKPQNSNSSIGPETIYPDGARRVTTDELETLIREGKAFVVDVRSQDSFDMGHIPGSRLIPAGEILNHVKELPADKTIVTYCS
jgi:3-mercaptopyruvate sulfurtransferase SseA